MTSEEESKRPFQSFQEQLRRKVDDIPDWKDRPLDETVGRIQTPLAETLEEIRRQRREAGWVDPVLNHRVRGLIYEELEARGFGWILDLSLAALDLELASSRLPTAATIARIFGPEDASARERRELLQAVEDIFKDEGLDPSNDFSI